MSGSTASSEPQQRLASAATASVLLLRSLLAGAARLGITTEELSRAVGVPSAMFTPEALVDPDGRVPSSVLLRLWEYLPTRCPDESFGFWLAEQLQAPPLSLATWVISNSPTLGQGLERALRYQRLLHDEAQSELLTSDTEVAYRHQIGKPPFRAPSAAIEFGFLTFLQLAGRLTGSALVPRRVLLRHAGPGNVTRHRALFGPGVVFSADADELVLDRGSLALPVLGSDPTLARIVEGHVQAALGRLPTSNALGARVRAQIHALLEAGTPSVELVSERLHLSRRTLQRQLSAAGTSFAKELDATRHELALRYLSDPRISLQEAAFLLGFSEPSAFHRAFSRWTGRTPASFRREKG